MVVYSSWWKLNEGRGHFRGGMRVVPCYWSLGCRIMSLVCWFCFWSYRKGFNPPGSNVVFQSSSRNRHGPLKFQALLIYRQLWLRDTADRSYGAGGSAKGPSQQPETRDHRAGLALGQTGFFPHPQCLIRKLDLGAERDSSLGMEIYLLDPSYPNGNQRRNLHKSDIGTRRAKKKGSKPFLAGFWDSVGAKSRENVLIIRDFIDTLVWGQGESLTCSWRLNAKVQVKHSFPDLVVCKLASQWRCQVGRWKIRLKRGSELEVINTSDSYTNEPALNKSWSEVIEYHVLRRQ